MPSKNSSGETYGKGRTRNFATVVYPESAPDDWKEVLSAHFVPSFVSPLHDSDVNPTGEQKKPHYHVIIMFDSPKTPEQAKSIFDLVGGVGCEKVNSIRGYARYLCHLDNPEKAQYSTDEVVSFCGADYLGIIGLVTDKHKAISEMIDFCIQNEIFAFADLLEYARDSRFEWFRVLCDNGAYVVKEYLKSRQWRSDRQNERNN